MNRTALVVEDDPLVREIIEVNLITDGWLVVSAECGADALERLGEGEPDVVVLDVMLPDMSGLELCQLLRSGGDSPWRNLPILMLTALATQDDKLAGFASGADDYLTKPFDPRELNARLHALAERGNRAAPTASQQIKRGKLSIDATSYVATYADQLLTLKPQEFELLLCLAETPERVFSRDELYKHVWNYSAVVNSRTVDMHVSQLRRKLSEIEANAGEILVTVFGRGYKLSVPAE